MRVYVCLCCLLWVASAAAVPPGGDGHGDGATTVPAVDAGAARLRVEVFSDKVKNATALCLDDAGRLYVTETYRWRKGIEDNRDHTYWIMDDLASETNADRAKLYAKWAGKFQEADYFTRYSERVVRLEDADGDGRAEVLKEFAGDFDEAVDGPAIGLLAAPGPGTSIYLACIPHVWLLEDGDGDGVAEKRTSIADGFGPKNSLSGHDLHGLVWGPDGKLYFSMGDRGYNVTTREGKVLKDTNSGAVFRCNADGTELEIFYYGLRNPQEIAFNELGDLFTVDNNCDQGDSARVCHLIEGGDTGWTLGTQALTTYTDFIEDGGMEQSPHWMAEGLWKLRHEGRPEWALPPIAHLTNGPSGMVFNSGTSLPERYRNHFLVCDYKGAPNLCFLYSFRVAQRGAGYGMEDAHVLHSGVPNTDVDLGYDGKIYLADFGGGWRRSDKGNIYTLFDPQGIERAEVTETKQWFRDGFGTVATGDLVERLAHADIRVRQRAQFELAKRGARAELAAVAKSASADRFARFHAIWGLGQVGAADEVVSLLRDSDAEVRAQAVRTVGNIGAGSAPEAVRGVILDESPRVRSLAAIAAGKLGDKAALDAVQQLIEENADADVFLRHAGVFALAKLGDAEGLLARAQSGSRSLRLAVLLALRMNADPGVARFLEDADAGLAREAIRAINDLDIRGAVPVLAAWSKRYATGVFGGGVPDEMIFRRLLNANLRAGEPVNALTLLQLGTNAKLPEAYRLLALRTLALFASPPPIDPTLGIYRPLEPRSKAPIKAVLEAPLRAQFLAATGEIAAALTRAIGQYGVSVDSAEYLRRIRDSRQPVELRAVALKQLYSDPDFSDRQLLLTMLSESAPELRLQASETWRLRHPKEVLVAVEALLEHGDDADIRKAYVLLSAEKSEVAGERMGRELDSLLAGELLRTVRLDAYEAAAAMTQSVVVEKVKAIDTMLAAAGTDVFDFTLEGGDPVKGEQVFQNQGICMKCHRAKRGGGDAGPDLNGIARLRRPAELLRSVVAPSAEVVPGYGIASFALKNGTSVTGTPMEETDSELRLKAPSGEIVELAVEKIVSRSPVVSPMPPLAQVLSRQDLRDLMAFLKSLE